MARPRPPSVRSAPDPLWPSTPAPSTALPRRTGGGSQTSPCERLAGPTPRPRPPHRTAQTSRKRQRRTRATPAVRVRRRRFQLAPASACDRLTACGYPDVTTPTFPRLGQRPSVTATRPTTATRNGYVREPGPTAPADGRRPRRGPRRRQWVHFVPPWIRWPPTRQPPWRGHGGGFRSRSTARSHCSAEAGGPLAPATIRPGQWVRSGQ